MELVVFFRLKLRVVHLLTDVNHFLEVIHYFVEVVELKFSMTDFYYHIQNLLLTLHRGHGINFIKGILLQNNEVNQFRFPESHVIFYGHTVVTQDVDCLLYTSDAADEL